MLGRAAVAPTTAPVVDETHGGRQGAQVRLLLALHTTGPLTWIGLRVADPDWIQIQSGQWVQEGKENPQK